ncbi:SH3 domain-containing protein [Arsenicitalea aurantiaca]|uniref:SH3 domain-containing protein n=1 Tax=Arsenicitalea aurantiaca TaxID=1783274 RepID=A0A433XB49_9HYPH|nr:SH3 domain-containing protein [Arsenicitalea aurantiaca]RUT31317.1 SH3 domain-containing protein [Arsenicitalea aurantiaca]
MQANAATRSIARYAGTIAATVIFTGAAFTMGGQMLVTAIGGAPGSAVASASSTPTETVAAFREIEPLSPSDPRAAAALAVSVAASGRPAGEAPSTIEGVVGLPGAPEALAPSAEDLAPREMRRVTASSLNVRAAPVSGSAVLGSVRRDTRLAVHEVNGRWVRVSDGAGVEGWVFDTYLAPADTEMAALDR